MSLAAGLIDVALSSGMWELRLRAMTAADWLSELDPNDEIAEYGTIAKVVPNVVQRPVLSEGIKLNQQVDAKCLLG